MQCVSLMSWYSFGNFRVCNIALARYCLSKGFPLQSKNFALFQFVGLAIKFESLFSIQAPKVGALIQSIRLRLRKNQQCFSAPILQQAFHKSLLREPCFCSSIFLQFNELQQNFLQVNLNKKKACKSKQMQGRSSSLQTSFVDPMLVLGVKIDSTSINHHAWIKPSMVTMVQF